MAHLIRQWRNPQGQRRWFVWHRVPKSASTTVSMMICSADGLQIDHRHWLPNQSQYPELGNICHVGGPLAYQPWSIPSNNADPYHSVVITRSPRDRWLSAYRNHIFDDQCLGHTPSVDWVQANWEQVLTNETCQHHFATQTHCAGRPQDHTNVWPIHQLDRLAELLTNLTGRSVPIPHLHGSRHTVALTDAQIKWIDRTYQEDYDLGWWSK